MKNVFHPPDRAQILERLGGLTQDSERRWGSMTPEDVVCHLADPIRVALREKVAAPLRGPLRIPGLAHLVVWVMPWPKGAPTAASFLPGRGMTSPDDFERDKQALAGLIQRFAEIPADQMPVSNPVFGNIGWPTWGRLMWRHLDHHFRQFGV